jgi:hypothetical protein
VEVIIPANFVSEEALQEWEKGLWTLHGETHAAKVNEVAKYAARLAADNGGGTAWDGIGQLEATYMTHRKADVRYDILDDEVDTEMMDGP